MRCHAKAGHAFAPPDPLFAPTVDEPPANLVAIPASAETSLAWEVIWAGSAPPLAAMAKPRLKPVALAKRRLERVQRVKCINIFIVNSSLERQG